MNHFRSFFLTATTLLFISACSTPEDLTTPTLAPQFGTADDDIGIDVATVSSGRVYTLLQRNGPYDQKGYPDGYGSYRCWCNAPCRWCRRRRPIHWVKR